MKKVISIILILTIVLTLSGCSNEIKEANKEYDCTVYNLRDEERFRHLVSYKIVNKFWTNNRDGVYLEDMQGNEYFFSGSSWSLMCVKQDIIK